jgi:hypothetical protein
LIIAADVIADDDEGPGDAAADVVAVDEELVAFFGVANDAFFLEVVAAACRADFARPPDGAVTVAPVEGIEKEDFPVVR